MASPGSTLSLKTKVEELGVLDQITHLGKQFTKEEKKEYFNSLPGKKYKVGLIRNKELDTVIKIFTESFDFSKRLRVEVSKADTFVSKECRGGDDFEQEKKEDNEESIGSVGSVNTRNREEANAASIAEGSLVGGANNNSVDPYANVPPSASEPYNAGNLDDIPLNGFNRAGNAGEDELKVPPEKIGTASDFERLYLGWMNNPELALSEEDKQKRKNSMKSLFRFVFGTKNISDVTATTLQKKLRLAYTPLTPQEKLPCEDSGVWEDFRESLVYRRRLAMCELFAARDVLGGEQRLYINRKKELALGLRDLIDVLDRNVYPCMVYAYDAGQHEEDESTLMNDEEFSRILKVFRTFVKDKKEGRAYYSMNNLKKELSKKDASTETASALYAELLSLLTWMAGMADATAKIAELEKDLTQIRGVAAKQKEDITELENLVLLLSVLLAMSEKIHKLRLALAELKCQAEKCCNKKRAEKLARSVAVQQADIQTLEKEIQTTNEEYQVVVSKLKKTIGQQTDDIQELEELVLALTQILISIDKLHTIRMSLEELRQKVKECCEKKKQVDAYTSQLEALNKVLSTRDQNAQTMAAKTMVDQGMQFANTANSELDKQIAELRQRIQLLMQEDAKKGRRIEELETESANKDVIIRELEEVTEALLAVIIGIKETHDIERSLAALKAAIELCCERRKTARECKEKLDLLEARIRELMTKEGRTKELESALSTIQEQRQKAEEAGAALKGQVDALRTELEEVMSDSKAELESVRTDLREEQNKDSKHAAELAGRIADLEAQILAAEAAVKEATTGRAAMEATLRAEREAGNAEKAKLQRNLNAARATAAGYERELAEAQAMREAAAAAAAAREEAAAAAKRAADEEVARLKEDLEAAFRGAMNLATDLDDQLTVALAKQAVTEAEAAARIAASEAAAAAALAQAAAAEEGRAAVAANRNKLTRNLQEARAAVAAAEAARDEIDAARGRAESQLAGALIEINRWKEHRDRMNDVLKEIKRRMAEQDERHATELAAARAAVAAAQAEVETSAQASQAERDALAAQLAERVAALSNLQGQQTQQAAAMAELQTANAALAAKLAAVNAAAEDAKAKAKEKNEEAAGLAAELAKIEEAARKAAEDALEAHKEKIAGLVAAHKAELEGVKEAATKAVGEAQTDAERRIAAAEAEAAAATGEARVAAQKEVEAARAAAASMKAEANAEAEAARAAADRRVREAEDAAAKATSEAREAAKREVEAARAAAEAEKANAERRVREAEAAAAKATGEARAAAAKEVQAARAAAEVAKANAERRVKGAEDAAAKATGEARAAAEKEVQAARAAMAAMKAEGNAVVAEAQTEAEAAKANAERRVREAEEAAAKATGEARAAAEKEVEAARAAAEAAKKNAEAARVEAAAATGAAAAAMANMKSRAEAAAREQQTEMEELARKSAQLAAELEAARAAAAKGEAAAGAAAGEINRLSLRIQQLQRDAANKNAEIDELGEQLRQFRAKEEKPKSVFNRLYPGAAAKPLATHHAASPPQARAPWRPGGSAGQYTDPRMIGVSGASPGSTRASKVGARGSSHGGGQIGGAPKKSFCEVMLTLLLLELSQHEDVNVKAFLKKAGTTLDELGQCPLVLRALGEIMDETLGQEVPEDGYKYSPTNVTNTAFAEQLEAAYAKNFTPAEKEALLHSAPPIMYYSKSPEEFEGILGQRPYFLNGVEAPGKEVRLRGVDLDDDEDPVMMTGDERELVEKGGVPLGAIVFLYLTCLKDHEEEEGEGRLALRSYTSNDAAN